MNKNNILQFKMTNLPNMPWFTYYKLKRYGNSVLWSSIPKNKLQYQAEHFWLTDDEFKGRLMDKTVRK